MTPKEYTDKIAKLQDRSVDVRTVGNDLVEAWSFDLDSRKPGIAYVGSDGTPVTTLDMACALAKLVEWEPMINIPEYEASGPRTTTEGQIVVSKDNRHGKLTALISNQDVFNFSLRIFDMNVMGAKDVGDFRNFKVFDNGNWHEGFRNLQFQPTEEEKKVMAKFADGNNSVAFDTFIHINRWPSLYGRYYQLAKHLIERCADELKWVKKQVAEIAKALNFPKTVYPKKTTTGETKPATVWKFNLEMKPLELSGEYGKFPATQEGFDAADLYRKRVQRLLEIMRFQTRATEYAFFTQLKNKVGKHSAILDWFKTDEHPDTDGFIPKAGWVKDREWVVGWQVGKRSKGKKYWCRMELAEGDYLQFNIAQKTVQVAA